VVGRILGSSSHTPSAVPPSGRRFLCRKTYIPQTEYDAMVVANLIGSRGVVRGNPIQKGRI
jgi:hypothetical protein